MSHTPIGDPSPQLALKLKLKPKHSAAWESPYWQCAVSDTSVLVCLDIWRLLYVHRQVSVRLKIFLVLCHLILVKQKSTWITGATQQPDFAAALCVQSMFPNNIVVGHLYEDKALPEVFITGPRVGVSSCVSVVPINWDSASEDLEVGLLVDCTGMCSKKRRPPHKRKRKVTRKAPPPPLQGIRYWGWGGVGTCYGKETKAQSSGHSHTAHPLALSETDSQQGNDCLCTPFHPLPTNSSIQCRCYSSPARAESPRGGTSQ